MKTWLGENILPQRWLRVEAQLMQVPRLFGFRVNLKVEVQKLSANLKGSFLGTILLLIAYLYWYKTPKGIYINENLTLSQQNDKPGSWKKTQCVVTWRKIFITMSSTGNPRQMNSLGEITDGALRNWFNRSYRGERKIFFVWSPLRANTFRYAFVSKGEHTRNIIFHLRNECGVVQENRKLNLCL